MKLPDQYAWLDKEPGPKVLRAMLAIFGTKEAKGAADNPVILGWGKDLGIAYKHDATAWCGLAIGKALHDAGYKPPNGLTWAKFNPLWAANYASFGQSISLKQAMLGDILLFHRTGGNHVGLYLGETKDGKYFLVIGGNQGDEVSIKLMPQSRLWAVRRCPFKIGQPPNIRKIYVTAAGKQLSLSEA